MILTAGKTTVTVNGVETVEAEGCEVKMDRPLNDMRYWMKGLDKIRYACSASGGSHSPVATKARGYVTVKCAGCGWTMVMHHSVFEQLLREQEGNADVEGRAAVEPVLDV